MSKRFTDSTKWKRQNFRKLSTKMKLCWLYLLDNCEHDGLWHIDTELMSFQIGEEITLEEIKKEFKDSVQLLNEEKLFIKSFIEFQYSNLNPNNRVHKSILNRLKKEGASKDLIRSFNTPKDKDKDKEEDKEKEKEKEQRQKIEEIYLEFYPLKKGKTKGVEKILKQIKSEKDLQDLKNAVKNYASDVEGQEPQFIKHFYTFAGEWRDWIEVVREPNWRDEFR